MIHPFAHLTSNYAFARRGLDAFSRPAGRPAGPPAGGFEAAADEVISASSDAPAGPAGTPPPGRPEIVPPAEASGAASERPLPHIPRFADVPPGQRWPDGPYRQAPPEYGGEWWQVSPFTGEQPWLALDRVDTSTTEPPAADETVDAPPQDFTRIFGPRPGARYSVERIRWEQDLRYFKQTGVPEGFTAEQVEAASDLFETWGLGRPEFYEGRYGWSARFPDSAIPDFEANPHTALTASHLVVARYQIRLAQAGESIDQRHPFVPPQVFRNASDA